VAFLLEVCNLSRYFDGLAAVNDLSFKVSPGRITGLIGPNGAGKSTVFNLITGFLAPTKGQIIYRGEDISGLKPHQIARRGIARTFQLPVLFPEFSVQENILMGSQMKSSVAKGLLSRSRFPEPETQRADAIIDVVGLSGLRDQKAGDLPHGHQQILKVAIVLGSEPELLLLDEPVTGMNVAEIKLMTNLIRTLESTKRITIMLVEHNVRTVMDLCEKVIVMNFGTKIAEGTPDEIKGNKDVIKAYLGTETA
jgi:branched-chain amino acid transport system ATP-binding protein